MTVPGELNRWSPKGTCSICGAEGPVMITHEWTGQMGASPIVESEHLCPTHYGSQPTFDELQAMIDELEGEARMIQAYETLKAFSYWLTIIAVAGVVIMALYHLGRAWL